MWLSSIWTLLINKSVYFVFGFETLIFTLQETGSLFYDVTLYLDHSDPKIRGALLVLLASYLRSMLMLSKFVPANHPFLFYITICCFFLVATLLTGMKRKNPHTPISLYLPIPVWKILLLCCFAVLRTIVQRAYGSPVMPCLFVSMHCFVAR